MEHHTYEPSPALESVVKSYWTLSVPKEVPKGRQQILSDGCMDLIFNLGDDVYRILPDESKVAQPSVFILGQITKSMWVEPTGLVETFAARFHPGGFSYFTKVPMKDLADKDTDLRDLFDPQRVDQLEATIRQTSDVQARMAAVDAFLIDCLESNLNVSDLVTSMIDKIMLTDGNLQIKNELKANPSQRRTLERLFAKQVGTSPKQLCRAIRLQKTLKSMIDANKNLTDIGYDSEFYDQAHFIKDFKGITGVTPKQFFDNEDFRLSTLLYGDQ